MGGLFSSSKPNDFDTKLAEGMDKITEGFEKLEAQRQTQELKQQLRSIKEEEDYPPVLYKSDFKVLSPIPEDSKIPNIPPEQLPSLPIRNTDTETYAERQHKQEELKKLDENVMVKDINLNIPSLEQIVQLLTPKGYTEIKKFSEGGSSRVCTAINPGGVKVAVKAIWRGVKVSDNDVKNEIEILTRLKPICKENFLCIEDFIITPLIAIIVTEFLKDYSDLVTFAEFFRSKIVEFSDKEAKASSQELKDGFAELKNKFIEKYYRFFIPKIFDQLICSIRRLHKMCLYHRDIKPDNILVNQTTGDIKIIDYGISCFVPNCNQYKSYSEAKCNRNLVGTYQYMCPDLMFAYFDDKPLTLELLQKSDIWSIGWTFIAMINFNFPSIFDLIKEKYYDDEDFDTAPAEDKTLFMYANGYKYLFNKMKKARFTQGDYLQKNLMFALVNFKYFGQYAKVDGIKYILGHLIHPNIKKRDDSIFLCK